MAAELPVIYTGHGFSLKGEKSRIVLPLSFRTTIVESSEVRTLCLAKHDRWNCLTGFGITRRAEFASQIDREEEMAIRLGQPFDREMRQIQLYGFLEVPFDASGRFIMPDHLSDIAGLEDGVYFHGAGSFFTLWSPSELYKMGEGWEGAQSACRKLEADISAKAKGKQA